MSLHPKELSTVPEETARVARAAFPKGNPYLTLRDGLGVIYEDETFVPLFKSTRGRPAESPGCLALVTALQFAESKSDRQAADAVRGRIDCGVDPKSCTMLTCVYCAPSGHSDEM